MVKDSNGKWDRRGMAVATNGQHEESVVMKMFLGEKTHKGSTLIRAVGLFL